MFLEDFFIYLHHEGLFKCFITFLSFSVQLKMNSELGRDLNFNDQPIKFVLFTFYMIGWDQESRFVFDIMNDLIGLNQPIRFVFDLILT